MAYRDPEAQREYQRQWMKRRRDEFLADKSCEWWMKRRRDEFFADKSCEWCGSTENLQLDHKDRAQKISHKMIWSWSIARRKAEIAKCQILCKRCHDEKSASEVGRHELISRAKLTEDQVVEILSRADESGASLAR